MTGRVRIRGGVIKGGGLVFINIIGFFGCLGILFFVFWVTAARGGDEVFVGPANYGGTGVIETPNARLMKEGQFRLGAAQVDPYRYYYGAVSPFSFLEIDGRFTEVLGVEVSSAPPWQGYGNYKDKAMDIKLRFLREGKWWPALALGIMDPHGTRIYPAQYLVASKQIYPFDFTIGFGNGRFGKSPLPSSGEEFRVEMFTHNASWRADGQFFGSIQFAPTRWLTLMAEYSPIAYEKQTHDPAQRKFFSTSVPSKFNFGARFKPWDWLEADVTYQRGQRIGVNLSLDFDLGRPMVPLYNLPYKERPDLRYESLKDRIVRAMESSGFSGIAVLTEGETLHVEAQNDTFYYTSRALGEVLKTLAGILGDLPKQTEAATRLQTKHGKYGDLGDEAALRQGQNSFFEPSIPRKVPGTPGTAEKAAHSDGQIGSGAAAPAPGEIRSVHLILSHNGIPIVKWETTVEDLVNFYGEIYTTNEYLRLVKVDTSVRDNVSARPVDRKWWNWGVKPSFEGFLNDPSGFFKYRLGAEGWITLNLWRGFTFTTGLEGYPLNNISSSNIPFNQAVRSDSWLYSKEKVNMNLLMMEQVEKLPGELYGRLSGGYLEVQYGGLDVELAKALFGGRILVGLSGSYVKKRETDHLLSFKKTDYKAWYMTGFFNTRLNIPELEAYLDVKAGQFLAGDRGAVFRASKFFNGVILSAWYSFTNTSFFTDQYNKGYHDKGIAITIPLRLFKGSDSRTSFNFSFSPWTRDVAQDVSHFTSLFNVIQRNTPVFLNKDLRTKGRGLDF